MLTRLMAYNLIYISIDGPYTVFIPMSVVCLFEVVNTSEDICVARFFFFYTIDLQLGLRDMTIISYPDIRHFSSR